MSELTTWTTVNLTDMEMRMAAMVGAERQLQSAGSPGTKHGLSNLDPWTMHLNGAAAELAVAKALALFWPGSVGTFRAEPDIPCRQHPPGIEVRWISQMRYDLKIRHDDSPERMYVLVSGFAPRMTLHGWYLGSDAKQPEFWTELGNGRPGLWCVPKERLHGPQGRKPSAMAGAGV